MSRSPRELESACESHAQGSAASASSKCRPTRISDSRTKPAAGEDRETAIGGKLLEVCPNWRTRVPFGGPLRQESIDAPPKPLPDARPAYCLREARPGRPRQD